jgi:hypothetical protein
MTVQVQDRPVAALEANQIGTVNVFLYVQITVAFGTASQDYHLASFWRKGYLRQPFG